MSDYRVLVIDDDTLVRCVIKNALEMRTGFIIVGIAEDIVEGRAMLAQTRPDVVVLDIHMPGLSGLDYLDELRGTDHPAVVIVSSNTTPGSAAEAEAIGRGADACFEKRMLLKQTEAFVKTLKRALAAHGDAGRLAA